MRIDAGGSDDPVAWSELGRTRGVRERQVDASVGDAERFSVAVERAPERT